MSRNALPLPVPGRSAAPHVAYGPGAVLAVPDLVTRLGARRVLLVCGRRSFEASGASTMLPRLREVAEAHRWDAFRANTDAEDLTVGLDQLRRFDPDLVLAVGGGSAIDMAKLLVSYDEVPASQLLRAIRTGAPAASRSRRLVLAPTTSGSGAEATHFAVVYIGDEKFSIAGPAMRADGLVLDPSLTLSGTPYQRATSGIDAATQAIESLWATGATARSQRFARHALRLLLPAIEPFAVRGDAEAASAMMIGAHLAGRAIDISKTTAAHALSYAITKGYGVSHGHAVALTLGHFISAHASAEPDALRSGVSPRGHEAAMGIIFKSLGAASGTQACHNFRQLLVAIGLPTRLRDVGVESPKAAREIAGRVNSERLSNNPVEVSQQMLQEILNASW